jgi:hypothetical protein
MNIIEKYLKNARQRDICGRIRYELPILKFTTQFGFLMNREQY